MLEGRTMTAQESLDKVKKEVGFMSKILVILLAVLSAANAQPQGGRTAETSVFGVVRVGEKFALEQCVRMANNEYVGIYTAPCYEHPAALREIYKTLGKTKTLDGPLQTGNVLVRFSQTPNLVAGVSISVQVIEGNAEFIQFQTAGVSTANDVFEALKIKYGAPTKAEQVKVKTMQGAEFSAPTAQWKFDNLTVLFEGVSGRVDQGQVIIATKKGMDFEEKIANQTAGPKL
jgi:hypothetical protein